MIQEPFSKKQRQFILESTKKWNIAHGSVRCGKTVGINYRFLEAVNACPDSKIYIVGHTSATAYRNVVESIMMSDELSMFRPFCSFSNHCLYFKDKKITILGAKDEGALGQFTGDTWSIGYCDEITLYPTSIINMIDTRLSRPHSIGFASTNPSQPDHIVKKWIDQAEAGDPNYYALHFTLDDNPYVDESYKQRIRDSLSGIFYKRNYLGLWCLAEGAIFDFFDREIHVLNKPPRAADYWIAGIDFGSVNASTCLVIGVSTGQRAQEGKRLWVEAEYYWDFKKTNRQKTVSEFAKDMKEFLEPYAIKSVYIDPSAAALKLDLNKLGIHTVNANNEVLDGIQMMTSEMAMGNLYVLKSCPNLIREIEGYVWDETKAKQGEDAPKKKADHALDALRYAIATHKVNTYNPYSKPDEGFGGNGDRYNPRRRGF